jgi:hypothetical protein
VRVFLRNLFDNVSVNTISFRLYTDFLDLNSDRFVSYMRCNHHFRMVLWPARRRTSHWINAAIPWAGCCCGCGLGSGSGYAGGCGYVGIRGCSGIGG